MFDQVDFSDPGRVEAEAAAVELTHQLNRIGVDPTDLRIIDPCERCGRGGHTIAVGVLHVDAVRELAEALRAVGPRCAS